MSATDREEKLSGSVPRDRSQGAKVLFDSSPDISTSESEMTFSRFVG